ncbi:MAG: hypothetical protein E6I08_03895 [Chloroflexi bacterium]|nr:MAG: hypothetical protein E6I08_03895 [Chloroflexota bacterium]
MADETAGTARPKRKYTRRSTSSGTASTRRRRVGGAELVDSLNGMVSELIKENRKLRRQVERLSAKGKTTSTGTIERGLRGIQRRVQRAMGSAAPTRRRARRATSTRTRKPSTNGRRRRRSTSGTSSSS